MSTNKAVPKTTKGAKGFLNKENETEFFPENSVSVLGGSMLKMGLPINHP
jgi:hypothetical protein